VRAPNLSTLGCPPPVGGQIVLILTAVSGQSMASLGFLLTHALSCALLLRTCWLARTSRCLAFPSHLVLSQAVVVERHVPGFADISEHMTAHPPQMPLLNQTLCQARGMIRSFWFMLQPSVLSRTSISLVVVAGAPLAVFAQTLNE
jgi:hypothetical protein